MDLLEGRVFLDSQVVKIGIFVLVLALGMITRGLISKLVVTLGWKLIENGKVHGSRDEFVKAVKGPVRLLLTLILIEILAGFLDIPQSVGFDPARHGTLVLAINYIFEILVIISVTLILIRFVDFVGSGYYFSIVNSENRVGQQLYPFIRELVKILIVIIAFFFTLAAVFGLNIGGIIAGLGIGGLAVALAAKETLENLFASFTIFLDKPFVVGDLVEVDGIKGFIEKVGFRSTRIRTMDQSFVTMPNKMMVDQAVDNLSMRKAQRVRFNFILPFDVETQVLKQVMKSIMKYLNENPNTNHEQDGIAGFSDFFEYGIRVTVTYYIQMDDPKPFGLIKQEVNLAVLDIVKSHGVSFISSTIALPISY